MIEFMGFLMKSVWELVSIPIQIDNITLRIWYFPVFAIICSVVWKFIFGGGNSRDAD